MNAEDTTAVDDQPYAAADAPDDAKAKGDEKKNTLTPDLFKKAMAAPPRIVGVMCPSIGIQMYVRQLPDAGERKALAHSAAERKNPADHSARVLAATICYANGTQNFDPLALETIGKAQPQEMRRLYETACHLNGVGFVPALPPRPTGPKQG